MFLSFTDNQELGVLCITADADYPGGLLAEVTYPIDSVYDCLESCVDLKSEGCVAYTYIPKRRRCVLRNNKHKTGRFRYISFRIKLEERYHTVINIRVNTFLSHSFHGHLGSSKWSHNRTTGLPFQESET